MPYNWPGDIASRIRPSFFSTEMSTNNQYSDILQKDEEVESQCTTSSDDFDEESLAINTKDIWQPISSDSHTFIGAIEGLRGLAVCLVLYCHTFASDSTHLLSNVAGSTGVSIFFVLSGFLITGILIRLNVNATKSSSRTLKFSVLRTFYVDRFVRLYPSLSFMLVFTIGLTYFSGGDARALLKPAVLVMTYTSNIQSLWRGAYMRTFFNTWSLAVEEQYYVLWSLCLPFILKFSRRGRTITLMFLIITSYTSYLLSALDEKFIFDFYISLPTNVYKMLIGSSLRLLPVPPMIRKPIFTYLGIFGIGALIGSVWGPHHFGFYQYFRNSKAAVLAWSDPFTVMMTVLIICGLHGGSSKNFILDNRAIRFIGKISYAAYLFQWPLICYSGNPWRWYGFAVTSLAVLVAQFSTFMIEDPIRDAYRRWKEGKRGILA